MNYLKLFPFACPCLTFVACVQEKEMKVSKAVNFRRTSAAGKYKLLIVNHDAWATFLPVGCIIQDKINSSCEKFTSTHRQQLEMGWCVYFLLFALPDQTDGMYI
jgi:hypothetical protein